MKFRTEIEPAPPAHPIEYGERILALGSCFADEMARRMIRAKFRTTANPSGVLFNPLSVADAIDRAARGALPAREELFRSGQGCWCHYGFHGSLSDDDPERALEKMRRACGTLREALAQADRVIVTFGTARIYRVAATGEVAANCHKMPAACFRPELLRTAEIVEVWQRLLRTALRGKRVLFTVSPVRHLNDGLAGNFLSKAILRTAIAALCEERPEADYFPAYEILTDDLRDYRFYADDLTHPSSQAVRYVWEKFVASALSAEAQGLVARTEAVAAAVAHRPLHPGSQAHRDFAARTREEIRRLELATGADFTDELAALEDAHKE